MTSTTSQQNDPGAVPTGPGPWVGVGPDGAVVPAPYLFGAPGELPPGASGIADFPGATAAGARRRRAELAVFGAAALTGVLAVIAPFLVLWRYGFSNGLFAARTVVNGWGAVSAQPASFASSHSHDTDYGLPMVLAAGFLLGGAVVYAITRRAVAAALPISVGASVAAGTALLLALDRGGRDSATTGTDTWAVGPGFWLIMAVGGLGVVAALAAAVLAALDLRAAPASGQPAAAPGSAPYDDRVWVARPDPAWTAQPDPAWAGQSSPTRYAPPDPAWTGQPDPARFAPPWAP